MGFPLSLLFGVAMLAWTGGATRWKLLSLALWVAGFVWLVAYWLG